MVDGRHAVSKHDDGPGTRVAEDLLVTMLIFSGSMVKIEYRATTNRYTDISIFDLHSHCSIAVKFLKLIENGKGYKDIGNENHLAHMSRNDL